MSKDNLKRHITDFFRDAEGNVVIWQTPNLPLIGWAAFAGLSKVAGSNENSEFFGSLSFALLLTWAYLEITTGKSLFRKCLGATVMIMMIVNSYPK